MHLDHIRRRFLIRSAMLVLAGILPRHSTASTHLAYRPAAFDAGHTSVLIWAGHTAPMRVQIEFRQETAMNYQSGPVLALTAQNGFCDHAKLINLQPGQRYTYRIVAAQTKLPLSDPAYFRTAPLAAGKFSFVYSADISEEHQPYTLFTRMSEVKPDFFLLLGDSAYTDYPSEHFKPSLNYYRGKHANVRRDQYLQGFLSRHLSYAVWDDHEVENNFHSEHPQLEAGLQAFRDYWPSHYTTPESLYRRFSWCGIDFFILDTRRYRSPHTLQDGPTKTMLGAQQKDWFKTVLSKSTAPFKFVISSVPFHGGSSDTWGNYATERDELEWYIHQEKIRGVIFLTGDYHLARVFNTNVIEIPEFMAGPIASFAHFERLPQRREFYRSQGGFFYGDGPNFGYWQIDSVAGTAILEYRNNLGQVLFKTQLHATIS